MTNGKCGEGRGSQFTASMYCFDAMQWFASSALTVTRKGPTSRGVPEITPAGESVSPIGSPVAVNVTLLAPGRVKVTGPYGAPAIASDRNAGAISVNGHPMTTVTER